MPSVGTELCGHVAFGGDPIWVDATSVASCSSKSDSGLQRLTLVSAEASAECRSFAGAQRCTQLEAIAGGWVWATGRFVHLVSVAGQGKGKASCTAFLCRLVQIDADASALAADVSILIRVVQCAVESTGQGTSFGLLQRCPQLYSEAIGMAKAWFVPITIMGGSGQRGELCRIVQHALDASIQSEQESRLVRLCQHVATGNAKAMSQALVSLLATLPTAATAGVLTRGKLSGTWNIRINGKAQALVEVIPVRLVPLHPSACTGSSCSVAKAHCLVDGIGPALPFEQCPEDFGVILFEVES